MEFSLPALGYSYGALEPYFDAQTMEIHHTRHHQAYIDKLNEALKKYPELQQKSIKQLLADLDIIPLEVRTAVRNQGGGHANHSFFWEILKKNNGVPSCSLVEEIKKVFGSFEDFQKAFNVTAQSVFGSGWAWLVATPEGTLSVISTPNQDSPLSLGQIPLLGLDVWEHAYYLKYQNKRPDYITAWWQVINWEIAEELYSNL